MYVLLLLSQVLVMAPVVVAAWKLAENMGERQLPDEPPPSPKP